MTPTPAAEVVSQVFQFFTPWTVQALNGYMSALPDPVPGNAPVMSPVSRVPGSQAYISCLPRQDQARAASVRCGSVVQTIQTIYGGTQF